MDCMSLLEIDETIKPKKKDSTLLGALAYLPVGGFIVPLIIYIVSKEDKFARYNALNALGFDLLLMVLSFVFGGVFIVVVWGMMFLALLTSGIALILIPFMYLLLIGLGLLVLALSIYFMYLAYNGKAVIIPLVSKTIKQYV